MISISERVLNFDLASSIDLQKYFMVSTLQVCSSKELGDEDLEGNVLVNPNFDNGLESWRGICCRILHSGSHGWKGVTGPRGKSFAIALERTEGWQGIEQDITTSVQPCETYLVRAVVRTAGQPHEGANVLATVRLEHAGSDTCYQPIGRYWHLYYFKNSIIMPKGECCLEFSFSFSAVPCSSLKV